MFWSIFLFIAGLLMLWASSELVIRNITPLARALGVKELVITILGVSVLSSMPELTVSAFAIARGLSEISVGNVIGSNFVTLTFVTAVCALFRPIDIRKEVQERESSWMILSSSLVLLMSLNGRLTRSEGLILILTYIPYAASVLKSARNGIQQNSAHAPRKKQGFAMQIFLLVIGIAGVIAGSKIAIDSGANLGTALGIPAIAIGVVLFAFGTSLPEFAIGLSATLKHKSDVTIGEVYASNIFTQMVVLGICCLIRPIQVPPALSLFAMPLLVLATVVIQIFVTTDLRIKRIEALGLLIFYVVFVTSQFVTLPAIEELLGF